MSVRNIRKVSRADAAKNTRRQSKYWPLFQRGIGTDRCPILPGCAESQQLKTNLGPREAIRYELKNNHDGVSFVRDTNFFFAIFPATYASFPASLRQVNDICGETLRQYQNHPCQSHRF